MPGRYLETLNTLNRNEAASLPQGIEIEKHHLA